MHTDLKGSFSHGLNVSIIYSPQALGGIVFADKAQRKKLEGVVWPEIKRLLRLELESLFDVRVPCVAYMHMLHTYSTTLSILPHQARDGQSFAHPPFRRVCVGGVLQSGVPAIVVEAAVMLEAGWQSEVDELWVVAVDSEVARSVRVYSHRHVCCVLMRGMRACATTGSAWWRGTS
jgi:dephospho-CoA kinase